MLLKIFFLCFVSIVVSRDDAERIQSDDCLLKREYAGRYECYNAEGEFTECLASMPPGTNAQLVCGEVVDEMDCFSGEWSIPFPECHPKDCEMVTSDSVNFQCSKVVLDWDCETDSQQLCEGISESTAPSSEQCTSTLGHNTLVHSECKEGFSSTLDSLQILQCKHGKWGNSAPECTRTPVVPIYPSRQREMERLPGSGCTLPPLPDHGSYNVSGYNQGGNVFGDTVMVDTYLIYSCDVNYELSESNKYSVCEKNNRWHSSPVCRKTCQMVSSYTVDFQCILPTTSRRVQCTSTVPSGTKVFSECKEMHYSSHLPEMICENGKWDSRTPKCKPDCGLEASEGVSYIIHGPKVKRNTFPWHVGIYQEIGEERKLEQICGGSLIQRHLVISAAHCFYSPQNNKAIDPEFYRVAAGKFYRSWDHEKERGLQYNIQKSEVEQIFIHEDYEGDHRKEASDLALVVLKQPFNLTQTVLPVCYDFKDRQADAHYAKAGNLGKVAGWGLNEMQISSEELRYLNVPVIDYKDCFDELQKYNFQNYLTPDKMCTGYTNGSTVCRGDSGGGLVFPQKLEYQKRTRWFLRGIVSNGPLNTEMNSCHPMTYTAYTRIIKLKNWLLEILYKLGIPYKS